jgi:hypothetical protein
MQRHQPEPALPAPFAAAKHRCSVISSSLLAGSGQQSRVQNFALAAPPPRRYLCGGFLSRRWAMRIVSAALVLLLALAVRAPGQEEARALIQRAIVAHGGLEKLGRIRADRVQLKGTLYVGSSGSAFTNEVIVQPPGQFKSVCRIGEPGRVRTMVYLLDGDKASIMVDGRPLPVSGSDLAQMRQTLQLHQAMKLVPLLTDPQFTIAHVGDFQYNGRVVVGIRVVGGGQRDLRLYFDRETALLVKTEHLLDGAGGKDVKQEAFYSDYKEMGGYLRAGKVTAYRDGKKVMEAQLVEAHACDHIDPAELTRP